MSRPQADIRQELRAARRARQRALERAARARACLERARERGAEVAAAECDVLRAKRDVRELEERARALEAEILEGWTASFEGDDAA